MVIAFIAFGVLFGASAAVYTFFSGGSLLLVLAAYSGAGTLAALGLIFMVLFFSESETKSSDWKDKQKSSDPLSA